MDLITKVSIIAMAAMLLLGLFVGFKRGFKLVGWKGLTCLFAYALFFVADTYLIKTPIVPALFGLDSAMTTRLALALASVLIMLLLHGVFTKLFRPSYYWTMAGAHRNAPKKYLSQAPEEGQRQLVWRNLGTPSIFGRLMGGVVCLANVASILAGLLTLIFIVLSHTSLSTSAFAKELFANETIANISKYVCAMGIDYLLICIIFNAVCKGYKVGLYKCLYVFFERFGAYVALGAGFAIPFLLKNLPFIATIIGFADTYVGANLAKIPVVGTMISANVLAIINQIVVGIVLAIVLAIVMKILTGVFRKLAKSAFQKQSDFLNSLLGCIVFFALGILLCLAVCILMYVLSVTFPVLNLDFLADGSVAKTLYEIVADIAGKLLK